MVAFLVPLFLVFLPQVIAQSLPAQTPATKSASPPAKIEPKTKVGAKDGLTYVWMEPSKFAMGCSAKDDACFDNEKTVHAVTLSSGYWIGETDVTQEAFERVTGHNPSHFKGANLPVESVTWAEAQAYCQAVGGRLPREAEWEAAARAGNLAADYGPLSDIAWYKSNSHGRTHAVGEKKSNADGLSDVIGNVWQWTADWYGDYGASPVDDPTGAPTGQGRVVRGGSWDDFARFERVSVREAVPPNDRNSAIGFRCVSFPAVSSMVDQAFAAAGGAGSINVTLPEGSAWAASSDANWITFDPASGAGNATVTYKAAPNPGAARSAKITVMDTTFTVEQQAASIPGATFAGSIADLVAQENWSTTFTLINTGDAAAQARLSLFNDAGSPQSLLVTTATSDPVQGASFDRTLPPHAALEIKTAGAPTAPLITGSTQVESSGAVGGFAIFKLVPFGQEAAFPLDARHAKSYLLAFDNTADAGLGVSVANASAQPATVNVVIRDHTGTQIANGPMMLPANGHTSFALASQYPATADKVGTVEFISTGAIAVLGLRTTPFTKGQAKSIAITAIPALSDIKPGRGSIAQISTGSGWETTFVLINAGTNPAKADLRFLADDGQPLEIPVQYPLSGTSTSANVSAVTQTLAPGATLLIKSEAPLANPKATIGSAQLSTDGEIGGFVLFRFNPTGQEAIVPLENRTARDYILAYDNTSGSATGVAVNNASGQPVEIPVVMRDEQGTQIGTGSLKLAANGHTGFVLAAQFAQTADRRGTLDFTVPSGANIGVLGIRMPTTLTFTTVPALAK